MDLLHICDNLADCCRNTDACPTLECPFGFHGKCDKITFEDWKNLLIKEVDEYKGENNG